MLFVRVDLSQAVNVLVSPKFRGLMITTYGGPQASTKRARRSRMDHPFVVADICYSVNKSCGKPSGKSHLLNSNVANEDCGKFRVYRQKSMTDDPRTRRDVKLHH